ncbi:hypothetical protein FJ444_21185 [Aestuariibacter sp. GS-14]|uniref:hypothetical protein n=1 Tax=Aestuariibacter sp. GS-14 TaxID=2590670 RepID=UPI00112CBC59|nr:hypothetical protein [Aestuariibacter sp. GS-14]TPV51740.1 hypothetical protein FJ444_21185 [Aestuariibacter sp. GS-14]
MHHGNIGQMFLSNLIATFKFVGIVWLPLSVFIIFDCYKNSDFSDAFIPLYLLTFAPAIAASSLLYTKLKNSNLNKFMCAGLFGIVNLALFMSYYFVGHALNNEALNLRFITVMSLVTLVTASGLYIQLPWKQSDA